MLPSLTRNLLLLSLHFVLSVSKDKKPSNIILFITDDQDVELGSLKFMPKLNEFIGRPGAKYEHGYVTTPMCCPSRSSMLTGLYVHNHHVYTNNENCSSISWTQTHETRTFATYLQKAGYKTGYFGKYLNRYSGHRIPVGWDHWMGLVRNSRYYNYTLNNNGDIEKHGDDYEKDYLPNLITNSSIKFINQMERTNSPFMAVLAYPAPHGPEDSAPQFQDMFLNVTSHHTPAYNNAPNPDKQWILRHTQPMLPIHKKFTDVLMTKRLQTLQSVDDGVQRIVESLSSSGQLDNTYIFFTSDHGYHLGQFGLVKGKAFPYEFDTHVPFFVRGPGINPNSIRKQPVLNIDLAPTFLDIAGVEIPEHMDGKSILNTFKSPNANLRDSFLIERGKMTFKRYESLSSSNQDEEDDMMNPPQTKRQKYLNLKMALECRKDKYQYPCMENQNWVCRQSKSGILKIKPCSSNISKRACQCQMPSDMLPLIRRARSISSPSYEELQALGAIVARLEKRDQDLKMQESWLSSKSLIRTQIMRLRAQLNELKQIRKYLRLRRPASYPNRSSKSSTTKNLIEMTLNDLSKCSCSNLVKRSTRRMDKEDKRMKRIHRLMKKERRRKSRNSSRIRTKSKLPKKQDHCKADVKMNCFSHDSNHWHTAPLWNEGSFCACTNSNNNTYWCVRNANETHNYLYCEYVTGMITYFDLNKDPYQLRNQLYTLTDAELSFMHYQVKELKLYSGQDTTSKEHNKPRRKSKDDILRRQRRKKYFP